METLIQFKTAKLAQEKGFNTPCWDFVNKQGEQESVLWYIGDRFEEKLSGAVDSVDYYLPSQSVLAKWLREVYGIYVYSYVGSYPLDIHKGYSDYLIQRKDFKDIRSGMTNTYEEAYEEGLYEALKLI